MDAVGRFFVHIRIQLQCHIIFEPEAVYIYIPAKTQKTENSNLHGFEVHRPSSKDTKLLLQVIKAIINHKARAGL